MRWEWPGNENISSLLGENIGCCINLNVAVVCNNQVFVQSKFKHVIESIQKRKGSSSKK